MQFLLDGVALGAEDTTAPYEAVLEYDGAGERRHTLTAVARDAAGHETTAAAVTRDGHQRHDGADRRGDRPGRGRDA